MLQILRNLLNEPRGLDRFQTYLKKMINPKGEIVLPIHGFNPMSREHVTEVLDRMLELKMEELLLEILTDVFKRLDFGDGKNWKVGLVISDDLKGGWTNRPVIQIERWTQFKKIVWRDFMPLVWWVTDPVTPDTVRQGMMRQLYEISCLTQGRKLKTLQDIMTLRVESMNFATPTQRSNALDKNSFLKIQPFLTSTDLSTWIACLFGDEAATSLGHPCLGMKAGDADRAVSHMSSIQPQ